jgi:uridine kinase
MFLSFINPSKKNADIIIPRGTDNISKTFIFTLVAIELVSNIVITELENRQDKK